MGALTLQNVVYATVISSIPRVGGDYVWQSRLLSGFWGFFLSWPGWVFCLWLWVPIYGEMLCWLVFSPMSALMGSIDLAMWWCSGMGLFISSMIVIVFVFIYVSLGMRWYARIQKALFYGGVAGMVLFVGALLTTNPEAFQSTFDAQVGSWLPAKGISTQSIMDAASGVDFASMWSMNWGASYMLFPMLLFWIMWTVWGATLFGEVREAGDWGKMFNVIQLALIAAGVIAIFLWPLFDHAIGYQFYQSLNYSYFVGSGSLEWLSSPPLLAAMALGNGFLAKLEVILMAGWFFSWSGTVFLSSTRVIFASSFDRSFPEIFADVKTRFNAPIYAILLMAIPAALLTIIYFFVPGFATLTMDATFAIAIAYFGTTIACMVFPLRRPELFSKSPVSKYKIGRIPVVSLIAAVYGGILLSVFWLWATKGVYGINNIYSGGFMIFMYAVAAVIYFIMKYYRKQEGVDLEKIHSEIPAD